MMPVEKGPVNLPLSLDVEGERGLREQLREQQAKIGTRAWQ